MLSELLKNQKQFENHLKTAGATKNIKYKVILNCAAT